MTIKPEVLAALPRYPKTISELTNMGASTMKYLLALPLLISIHAHAQTTPPPIIIEMYGDSTMAGSTDETGVKTQSNDSAPAQLARMIAATGYNATITNYGIPGETTGSLLNGFVGRNAPWIAVMTASKANIVIINDGMNDAPLDVGGVTSAQFESNYTQLIQIAQQQGKIVYIETPNPRNDTVGEAANQLIAREELAVAGSIPGTRWIGMQAAILNNFPQWPDHLPYGGVHPDDTLYTFKAAVEYYTLAPVLSLIYQPGAP